MKDIRNDTTRVCDCCKQGFDPRKDAGGTFNPLRSADEEFTLCEDCIAEVQRQEVIAGDAFADDVMSSEAFDAIKSWIGGEVASQKRTYKVWIHVEEFIDGEPVEGDMPLRFSSTAKFYDAKTAADYAKVLHDLGMVLRRLYDQEAL